MSANLQDPLQNNHRILVVDDNPTIHEDFRKILAPSDFGESNLDLVESAIFGTPQRSGQLPPFRLSFAGQGTAAVQLLEAALQEGAPFALAMVDVRMPPGMDGIETIKSMWQIQPDLQVAICTAYADYSWDDIITALGASHRLVILKKPFDPIEVIQMASALTSKWSFEREVALRQLGLQTKLWDQARRVEDTRARLQQEQQDRLRLEEGLRAMQKMDALGSLAAGIAHDFNNVLTVIQSHLSMNLMKGTPPPGMAESLEEVLVAARRASDLTRQLLNFSSRASSTPQPSNLSELLEAELAMLRRTLGKHIQIQVNHAPGLPEVMADPGSFGQIIVNLAVNARDAMPCGGRLTFSTRKAVITSGAAAKSLHPEARTGEFAAVMVSDSGTGMPPEILRQIFDPFFTTKNPGKGTGMGLAMVRGLVRQHGGWVTVSSVPGVGTDFEVYLPLVGSYAPPPPPQTPPPDLHSSSTVTPSTLLVVDDDPGVRHVITYVLQNQGHTVLAARDAREAWQLWRGHRHSVRLVITDINLPGDASGFDLGRAILGDDASLPLIFSSGYCPDILGQATSLQLGINYLPKPFDVLDLLNAVGHALTTAVTVQHLHARRALLNEGPLARTLE
jgi:signal transduction histidine kinase